MTMPVPTSPILAMAAVALCADAPAGASGQQVDTLRSSPARGLVHVTVVLDERRTTPVYLRRREAGDANVVIVGPGADAQALSDVVFGLLLEDARDTAGEERDDRKAMGVRDLDRPAYPWAAATLGRLRAADPEDVPGLGRHRVVRFYLEALDLAPDGSP